MLTLEQVTYQYQQETFTFDLSVQRGSITAVMGSSGAGKSTLLSLMAGFIQPMSGDIIADGHSVLGLAPAQRPFAMLFQQHNLFAHLTVAQNIALGISPGLKLTAEIKAQVKHAATQVGIADLLTRLPEQLSGGQRQRVALARCFVQQKPVWLLDEPFSALDPVLREEMLNLVRELAWQRQITVLMVTHHLSDAKAIASDFVFVNHGRIEVSDKMSALTQAASPQWTEFVRAAG